MTEAIMKFAGGMVGVTGIAIWRAYVLTVLWTWFVVSTFAVPALSIPAAMGLCITLALLRERKLKNSGDEEESIGQKLAIQALVPLFALGFGWIVKIWM